MDKYYIPKSEEFNTSFLWQLKDNGNWVNLAGYPTNLSKLLLDDEIRVKYLSQEDIESLGWELKTDLYVKDNLTLQVHKDSITIKYYNNFNNEWRTKVEQIIIKNKYELVKLLKQLGIG